MEFEFLFCFVGNWKYLFASALSIQINYTPGLPLEC